jgi:uncharacterized coiled-coil DUF342 family protein
MEPTAVPLPLSGGEPIADEIEALALSFPEHEREFVRGIAAKAREALGGLRRGQVELSALVLTQTDALTAEIVQLRSERDDANNRVRTALELLGGAEASRDEWREIAKARGEERDTRNARAVALEAVLTRLIAVAEKNAPWSEIWPVIRDARAVINGVTQ